MHVVTRLPRRRVERGRRMYNPTQRGLVSHDLGVRYDDESLSGLFNIGKMFTRMFTFKSHSFDFKNILGAVGSAIGTIGTGGIGTLVAPKQFGAHGKVAGFLGGSVVPLAGILPQKWTGMTAAERLGSDVSLAAVAAVGGGMLLAPMLPAIGGAGASGAGLVAAESAGSAEIGAALATGAEAGGGGFLSTIGTAISSGASAIGTGLKTVLTALPFVGQMFGGGGGQVVVDNSGGVVDPYAQQYANQYAQAQQAAYLKAQQDAMYQPGYKPSIPYVTGQYPDSPTMDNSYGDLRSPYTAIAEDGSQVQVDPATGQVIEPAISTPMLIGGGLVALLLVGYMWSDDK